MRRPDRRSSGIRCARTNHLLLRTIIALSSLLLLVVCGKSREPKTRALDAAIRQNDLVGAERAIAAGARINGPVCPEEWGPCGVSNWMSAVEKGHPAMVELLARKGADLNEVSHYDQTAVSYALGEGRFEQVALLIKLGASPETEFRGGDKLLHRISCSGRIQEAQVRTLLKSGASVNSLNRSASTPLLSAVGCDHANLVEILLAHGADPNAENQFGVNPLVESHRRNVPHIRAILLKAGASVPKSPDGRLSLGIMTANDSLVALALKEGAKIDAPGYWEAKTPIMHACAYGNHFAVTSLLNAGARVNQASSFGATPLMHAAKNGNNVIVKELLLRGADRFSEDHWSVTAVQYARMAGHEKAARLIERWPFSILH